MAYVKQTFVDGQLLSAAHLNYIEAALAELDARLALVEAGGGGAKTITFYWDDGNTVHTLTTTEGTTWEQFAESEACPKAPCECCGDNRKMFRTYDDLAGDTGNKICGYYGGTCPGCQWEEYDEESYWVCFDDPENGADCVRYDDVIVDGATYVGGCP